MALNAWNTQVRQADKFFDGLTDTSSLKEVAAGRNRIIYLLGHLVAVNDTMIGLFGLGERQYSHLDAAFVKSPDKAGHDFPNVSELRNDWKKSNQALSEYFSGMSADEWFSKHSAMTEEDLAREPWRNKLSVLINRTNHLSYHLGQLMLVKD